MDKVRSPKVDVVHNAEKFPWPFKSMSCFQVLLSHLWEHIHPDKRLDLMNEIWRIIEPDGQLLIAVPYATSKGAFMDPTHYPCPNEFTFQYFDPAYPLYRVYRPKPWEIKRNAYMVEGNMEVILEPRKSERGRPIKFTPKATKKKK